MERLFLMGNEAIGLGAMHAGVNLVCGYPGTPSTEILEFVAKQNPGDIYVEWSVNEKVAAEVAAGASYAGARTLVTMKQVGLNVASDPIMSLSYVGVKGGMVIVVADDPGPISSQTEQDTRTFARFAKLPVFDPTSPEEAYRMIRDAFTLSEELGSPVLFRPTTRICHACSIIETYEPEQRISPEGFKKDTQRWVIFPRTSFLNHQKIEARNEMLSERFSAYPNNTITGSGKKGIATGGASYGYVQEALAWLGNPEVKIFRVATPFPFPERAAAQFLDGLDEVLAVEELDPVIERELQYLCGKQKHSAIIRGKLSHDMPAAGENSAVIARDAIAAFLGIPLQSVPETPLPSLPVRPPVLCAGCPHRASFYAVKQAVKGRKAVFAGDIGCYTLGNAKPLDMVDTCLCMGADVTIAQGLQHIEPDALHFSFIGDSTFFASGIPGIVNAVYNQTPIMLVILNNATTAMTGQQPHPGTGKTMMGAISERISIPAILEALQIPVRTVNPFRLNEAIQTVQEAAAVKGVSAVMMEAPCIAVVPPAPAFRIDRDKCIRCQKCIRELGCPAIYLEGAEVCIDDALCYGCDLCTQVCPKDAIVRGNAI